MRNASSAPSALRPRRRGHSPESTRIDRSCFVPYIWAATCLTPMFTPHQDAALNAVAAWLKAKPGRHNTPPVFRLFGYAGTGKTTLAKHVAKGVDGKVLFAAFTGKAALVMRHKGCTGASTIHSLIYRPLVNDQAVPSFELWDDAPATQAKLIVIDECSMVDADLGRDLMSFKV